MTQPTPLTVLPSWLGTWLQTHTASRLSLEDLDAYYRGQQRAAWERARSERRFRLPSINIPRLVVDSIDERLDVQGFRMGGSEDADAQLWRLWQASDLDSWSPQCHLEALIYGRSFVLVWGEPSEDPRITVESAAQMAVTYDWSAPSPLGGTGVVTRAVKRWVEDDRQLATVYEPDRVLRLWAPNRGDVNSSVDQWRERDVPIENPFGLVPVVPFVNRPRTGSPLGESEMTDVLPITDMINELVDAMMVSARYHAMPRRYATGIDLGDGEDGAERTRERVRQQWQEAEAGRVWLSDSSDTRFGQFAEASLDNYIGAINMLTARAAALSGLPPHYFGQVADNPASADALRASEASLVKRAQRKQVVFGEAWERVMRLALLLRDGGFPDEALGMEALWRDAETPTVAQKADAAVKLVAAGIIDHSQAQEDLGYSPVQVERMAQRAAEQVTAADRARIDYARELQRTEGLSQNAALAAAGLPIAATQNSAGT